MEGLRTVGGVHLARSRASLAAGHTAEAFEAFQAGLRVSAGFGGMPVRLGSKGPSRRPNQPFFDQECRALKRQVRAARARGDLNCKVIERKYHSVVRSKERAHQKAELGKLIRERGGEPRKYWKRWKAARRPLPTPLLQVQLWSEYLGTVAGEEEAGLGPLSCRAYPQRPTSPADGLNAPITLAEVVHALHHLHNGRAPGLQGYPAELLRAAVPQPAQGQAPEPHLLAPLLVDIFNGCFQSGSVPADVNVSVITPVYKKGDALDPANYRPIAVTEPLMRLYAGVLNRRLVDFTEGNHLRAPSQAGFRPGLSCAHQLFALQHMIDHANHAGQPLYCCFLDLKGAYDKVPRTLLWAALCRLGVHGALLGAVQSLYANSAITVKVDGRCGPSVPSRRGVKQGCPLSPTLFGLFMDGLHRHLQAVCSNEGHLMRNGGRIPDLEYADDVCLVSDSPEGLQFELDATGGWCDEVGMVVGGEKTKVVVFGKVPASGLGRAWVCQGQAIQQVSSYPYLGLTFQAPVGVDHTFPKLQKQQLAAWSRLKHQYGKLNCSVSVGLLLNAYLAFCPPTASYGCEVWAFRRILDGNAQKARKQLELFHVSALRQIAGVRATTSTAILFRELGVSPLQHMWLKQGFQFWNNLAALPSHHPCHQLALDNCYDAVVLGVNNWASAFMRSIRDLGYGFDIRVDKLVPVDMDTAMSLLTRESQKCWDGLGVCPRTCPSKGAQLCTYERWFARPPDLPKHNLFLLLPLGARRLRAFLRFRMGCHDLPSDAGRRAGIPRHQRVCPRCPLGEVGDERHLIFSCTAVQEVRDRYAWLFRGPRMTMVDFMWHGDKFAVAKFVTECLDVYFGTVRPPSHQP